MEAAFSRWPKAVLQVYYSSEHNVSSNMLGNISTSVISMGHLNFQFEDFQMKWAFETLQRYRKRFCMFNDDVQVRDFIQLMITTILIVLRISQCMTFFMINCNGHGIIFSTQGTAGVALAGLLGAVRAQGRPLDDFVDQKIVVVGAGRCLIEDHLCCRR